MPDLKLPLGLAFMTSFQYSAVDLPAGLFFSAIDQRLSPFSTTYFPGSAFGAAAFLSAFRSWRSASWLLGAATGALPAVALSRRASELGTAGFGAGAAGILPGPTFGFGLGAGAGPLPAAALSRRASELGTTGFGVGAAGIFPGPTLGSAFGAGAGPLPAAALSFLASAAGTAGFGVGAAGILPGPMFDAGLGAAGAGALPAALLSRLASVLAV